MRTSTSRCCVAMFLLAMFFGPTASAGIFRWDNGELITTEVAGPSADLQYMDLRYGDFAGMNLADAIFLQCNLTSADFAAANLVGVDLCAATLTSADFAGAAVTGADFSGTIERGFTVEQFYSTASYQNGELSGVLLGSNDLSGWDFAGRDLTNAGFYNSALASVDFAGAAIAGADFTHTVRSGFTAGQFYSTASYQNGNLGAITLDDNDLTEWDFGKKNLTRSSFVRATLTSASFVGANLTGARLTSSKSSSADFRGANLRNARFNGANLTAADFAGADLTDANFTAATLASANFDGVDVTGANFGYTTGRGFTAEQFYSTANYQNDGLGGINLGRNDLSGWDFAGMNLAKARFWATTLTATDFAGANLTDADFHVAALTAADFTGAVITGATFENTTSRGFTAEQFYSTASYQDAELYGVWLSSNDLSGWDFSGMNLVIAGFHRATLTSANFAGANLTGADFPHATLVSADFAGATLSGASFHYATLTSANLAGANVRSADFREASLTSVNFTGANLISAKFQEATLTSVNLAGANLESARFHDANLLFCDLRGANVSDHQLELAASMKGTILPDGRIDGLPLAAEERLSVRDYNGEAPIPVTIESVMSLDPAAALRMVFVDDDWGSTISFEPGIEVALDGSLELLFADGTEPADLIGATFDLFDWEGAVLSGQFDEQIVTEAGAVWDTTRLYTTGEVTLLAVPEPSTLMLAVCGVLGIILTRMRLRLRRLRTPG